MTEFYAVCAAVATGALIVLVASAVRTFDEIRQTAQQARKTAAAVEQLALHLDSTAKDVAAASGKVHELADSLSFNWLRGVQVAMAVFQNLRDRWSQPGEATENGDATRAAAPDAARSSET